MTDRTVDGHAQTLDYDHHRRLQTVSDSDGTTEFLYDASGRRVATYLPGSTTIYVGDGYEQTTLHDTPPSSWTGIDAVAGLLGETTRTIHYPGIGYHTDGQVTWLLADHLGSTVATYTPDAPAGQRIARRGYLPFGATRHDDGIDTDIGYTGQRADDSTGLLYYRARHYDPTIGRLGLSRRLVGLDLGAVTAHTAHVIDQTMQVVAMRALSACHHPVARPWCLAHSSS